MKFALKYYNVQDWPRHRKECVPTQSYSMVATVPPPTEQHPNMIIVSAIFFSPEEGIVLSMPFTPLWITSLSERPRIIVVECRLPQEPSGGACAQPLINFPDGQADNIVVTQGLDGRQLRSPLQLWYSPTALSRRAPINLPINNMTIDSQAKRWYGMVVVLKFSGSRRQSYSHANLNDLADLSAYFVACR